MSDKELKEIYKLLSKSPLDLTEDEEDRIDELSRLVDWEKYWDNKSKEPIRRHCWGKIKRNIKSVEISWLLGPSGADNYIQTFDLKEFPYKIKGGQWIMVLIIYHPVTGKIDWIEEPDVVEDPTDGVDRLTPLLKKGWLL